MDGLPFLVNAMVAAQRQERDEALEATSQFPIAAHYDVMEQLDADVHGDERLAETEVASALRLMGTVPESVFLPCFGTGRHIGSLLAAGVSRVVGVDLSPKCVARAQERYGSDSRVELHVGDLRTWDACGELFDAGILLGNSYADIIHPTELAEVTHGMVCWLKPEAQFVMDYIGRNYLDRCRCGITTVWQAQLNGEQVSDRRTPFFDRKSGVMTINVEAVAGVNGDACVVWKGAYQKLVLNHEQVQRIFSNAGVLMRPVGEATKVNRAYYRDHTGELGMIARSTWWLGVKV